MHTIGRFVVLAALVAGILSSPLVQVSILHRHGAREEPQVIDGHMSWSNADLTSAGGIMSRQLGAALRARYNDLFPATMLPTVVVAQSTDISRTIQTGYGVLSTLFNSSGQYGAAIPYMHHVSPMSDDFMLAFASNFPSGHLSESYWNAFNLLDDVASSILGAAGVQVLVENIGAWCALQVMECALLAEDVAQCRTSNGGLSTALNDIYPSLRTLQMMRNKYLLGINVSSPFLPAGSVGYPLAQKWLTDAAAAVKSFSAGLEPPVLYHYSAHDNTIVGLYSAFGVISLDDNNSALWVPRFTETAVMEVFANGSAAFFHSRPMNLTAGSDFVFGPFEPLMVNCPSGGRSNVCDIAVLQIAVDLAAAPTAPEILAGLTSPQCWLPQEFRSSCISIDTLPSAQCEMYRSRCGMACTLVDANSVLDISTGVCEAFLDAVFKDNALEALVSAAAALLVGVILGRVILSLVTYEEARFPESSEYLEHVNDENIVSPRSNQCAE